jgi:biotin transport system permease protein/energy-coupling factor transport system permease protein
MAITTIFKYKTIKGPLHKLPALLKLFMLLPLSIFCLSLPSIWLALCIVIAFLLAAICGFTFYEQCTDLKPALTYGALMYLFSIFAKLRGLIGIADFSALVFIPHIEYIRISLRLAVIVQLSALLFRTTSALEIREGLGELEYRIKYAMSKMSKTTANRNISGIFSLFLSFIPELFQIWATINLAWKARGGKNGMVKIKTLVFVLISLSMEKASIRAKAIESRQAQGNFQN